MKKNTIAIFMLCAGISASAQNIIATRPANDPAGKILTMEETILSRQLTPKWPHHAWENTAVQAFPEEVLKNNDL